VRVERIEIGQGYPAQGPAIFSEATGVTSLALVAELTDWPKPAPTGGMAKTDNYQGIDDNKQPVLKSLLQK